MPLNIKDETVHAKAKRLAELTGTSITGAVSDAIDRRLQDIETMRGGERSRRYEALRAISRACAQHVPPGVTSTDHAELFYDEDGLPR